MRIAVRSILLVTILVIGLAGRGLAQVTTATLYGIVQDQSGSVIAGAQITLTHDATAAVRQTTTDGTGEFVFTALPVGAYTLKIEKQGFKAYMSKGIELGAAQTVRQNYALEVGELTQSVTVEAGTPLVNTVTTEQLQTYDRQKVTELPVARRNFSNLLRIGTGVTYTGDSVRMNGVGKSGVAFSVDGTDAGGNPEGRNSSNYLQPNLIDIMSIEAIQEVHTIKGVAPAEYGNVVGGQVNLLSRSGTNNWHGALFENFQSNSLNARNQRLSNKPGLT